MNASMLIVENVIKEVSSIEEFKRREITLIDHSNRFFSRLLSYVGVGIGFYTIVGCAQGFLLNNRLLAKKRE